MTARGHYFDEDAVCVDCGFDGAEWSHWRHHTYEGRACPDAKQPLCTHVGRKTNEYAPRPFEFDEEYAPRPFEFDEEYDDE